MKCHEKLDNFREFIYKDQDNFDERKFKKCLDIISVFKALKNNKVIVWRIFKSHGI